MPASPARCAAQGEDCLTASLKRLSPSQPSPPAQCRLEARGSSRSPVPTSPKPDAATNLGGEFPLPKKRRC